VKVRTERIVFSIHTLRNLWNKDTHSASKKCPYFRNVLISGCNLHWEQQFGTRSPPGKQPLCHSVTTLSYGWNYSQAARWSVLISQDVLISQGCYSQGCTHKKCVSLVSPSMPDCRMCFLQMSYAGSSTPVTTAALCAVGPTPCNMPWQ
jgi:hypothetical protein